MQTQTNYYTRFFLLGLSVVVFVRRANDPLSLTEPDPEEPQDGYTLKPIQLGAEVRGIKLNGYVPPHLIERIKRDVAKHQLLVFKDQGIIHADRHVEITKWFGPLKVTFRKHPAQQHKDVFRVSNDDDVGNGNSITLGWHVDGALPLTMISHSIFHILSLSAGRSSDTWFVSLCKTVEDLNPEQCGRLERLSFLTHNGTHEITKPLIYSHPITNRRTLVLYTGGTRGYMYDEGTPLEKRTPRVITKKIVKHVVSLLERGNQTHVYKHKWELGDFIIVDNQAVAHMAPKATKTPIEKVGLRLLHRASADSLKIPVKNYDPYKTCYPLEQGPLEEGYQEDYDIPELPEDGDYEEDESDHEVDLNDLRCM